VKKLLILGASGQTFNFGGIDKTLAAGKDTGPVFHQNFRNHLEAHLAGHGFKAGQKRPNSGQMKGRLECLGKKLNRAQDGGLILFGAEATHGHQGETFLRGRVGRPGKMEIVDGAGKPTKGYQENLGVRRGRFSGASANG